MDCLPRHFLLAAGILSCPLTAVMADDEDAPAQAAYPMPFSRPASMGKEYNTWRDAKGCDAGDTTVDVKRLPSRVDNSTRPQFPPVYKQKGEACGQFTAVA